MKRLQLYYRFPHLKSARGKVPAQVRVGTSAPRRETSEHDDSISRRRSSATPTGPLSRRRRETFSRPGSDAVLDRRLGARLGELDLADRRIRRQRRHRGGCLDDERIFRGEQARLARGKEVAG